jgi:hypothetical protein
VAFSVLCMKFVAQLTYYYTEHYISRETRKLKRAVFRIHELPRRVILGHPASGVLHSRKLRITSVA